jgi:hypothetical protein
VKRGSTTSIYGAWVSIRSELPTDSPEQVSITFSRNGKLDYWVAKEDRLFSQHMSFRIEGDVIVTGQGKKPNEGRNRFWFEANSTLVIEKDGRRTWFRRQDSETET